MLGFVCLPLHISKFCLSFNLVIYSTGFQDFVISALKIKYIRIITLYCYYRHRVDDPCYR